MLPQAALAAGVCPVPMYLVDFGAVPPDGAVPNGYEGFQWSNIKRSGSEIFTAANIATNAQMSISLGDGDTFRQIDFVTCRGLLC